MPAVVVRHLPRAELRLVTSAVDGQDLREAGRRLVLIGMGGCELTELRREGDLLGVADRLAAEEDDLPAQEGRADLSDGLVVEILAQVDAVDLSPGVTGERSDVDPQFVYDMRHRQVLQDRGGPVAPRRTGRAAPGGKKMRRLDATAPGRSRLLLLARGPAASPGSR